MLGRQVRPDAAPVPIRCKRVRVGAVQPAAVTPRFGSGALPRGRAPRTTRFVLVEWPRVRVAKPVPVASAYVEQEPRFLRRKRPAATMAKAIQAKAVEVQPERRVGSVGTRPSGVEPPGLLPP